MAFQTDSGENIIATIGIGKVSGDPVIIGNALTGVAECTADAAGLGTLSRSGTYLLSVKGHDGTSNAAIAEGDKIYYKVGATPVLNVNVTGVLYGYARAAVTSGATTTINVTLA